MDKDKLRELYALVQEMMDTCPDESECTDAENEVFDEIANMVQVIKNSKLI